MSSSRDKNTDEHLITITTSSLKDRLNRVYEARRKKAADVNSFEHLWDLKEMALLEGKSSVEVPRTWMDELDSALNNQSTQKN